MVLAFRVAVFFAGAYLIVGAMELLGSPHWRESGGISCLVAGIALIVVPVWFTMTSWLRERRKLARGFDVVQESRRTDGQ